MKIEDKFIMDIYEDIKNDNNPLPVNIDKAIDKIKNDYCAKRVFEWGGYHDCIIYFADVDCPNETYHVGAYDNISVNDEVFIYESKMLAITKFIEEYYENFGN